MQYNDEINIDCGFHFELCFVQVVRLSVNVSYTVVANQTIAMKHFLR